MDRIGNSSTSNLSYDPNTCEAPPPTAPTPKPVASCPDGSVAYGGGVCATTGLKGAPTPAQQYAANLARGETPGPNASTTSPNKVEQERTTLGQMMNDAGAMALDAARSAVGNGTLELGKKLEYEVELPNGCEAKFSVTASMGVDAAGQPELVAKASGSIEGKFGAMSAGVEFSFSHSQSGEEAILLGACVFAGLDQEAGGLADVQAKAGLCATYQDRTGAPAALELDAVAKAGAAIHLGGGWTWGHEIETRTPLSRETVGVDLLH